MKQTILLLLFAASALAQSQPLPKIVNGTKTVMSSAPVQSQAGQGQTQFKSDTSAYKEKPVIQATSAVTVTLPNDVLDLQPTPGGGLMIFDRDQSLVVYVKPDGTIKGDPVRALRMLATAMKQPEGSK